MKIRIALASVVVAALALAGSPAFAQDGADPKLCASINSILEKTPQNAWPEEPNVTLEWDGGSAKCQTRAGILTCDFANTQMLSVDQCSLFKDDMEQTKRDAAGRTYARTRAVPAMQACFAGSGSKSWIQQEAERVSQGFFVMPAGKPAFRYGETNRRMQLAGSTCVFNAFGFEFDPAK